MIQSSTGLAAQLMVTAPFTEIMNLCKIKIYSAPVPDDADAPVTGTLLLTITNNGGATGLTWETAATDRSAMKKESETWSGAVASSGTAAYFRIVATTPVADDGLQSSTQPRIQGYVGNTSGADLFFSNPVLTATDVKTLAAFSVELPIS